MKKRIEIKDLRIGMFVAELDRPWLESPFLFQGFVVENDDELGKLQALCDHVFVDEQRSVPADRLRGVGFAKEERGLDRQKGGYTARFEMAYAETNVARRDTTNGMIKLLDDRRLGKLISTDGVRNSVNNLMRTMLADPSVALWMTRIRGEDEFTAAHSMNVATLSLAFARHLGVPEHELKAIGLGALLHDIGLTEQAAPITRQSGPLTAEDFAVLRRHPLDGLYSIRGSAALDSITMDIIRWHHERVDGSGYPDGLKNEQIPRHVLIVAIADTYDAMVSDRAFRSGMPPAQVLTEMHRLADTTFGKDIVRAFIQCIGVYPATSVVRLNTGAIGVVMASDEQARLQPLLLMLRDEQGRLMEPGKYLDLGSVERKTGQRWYIDGVVDPRKYQMDLAAVTLPSF